MKTRQLLLLSAVLFVSAIFARAQIDTNGLTAAQMVQVQKVLTLVKNLKYQSGEIDLKGGLAKLSLPPGFSYLGPDDAETVLSKIWGNPPSETKSLGMLMPTGMTPLSSNAWAVTIDYSEDGYVKDDEAAKINYDDLLKKMQAGVVEENKERTKQGYPAITLVGWAAPPHYDAATHKLYWAKHLKVDGADEDTLNYSIRILGRHGVLELNAISALDQFSAIDQQTPEILGMVDFKEGSRYADFDPKTDKVAKYGIAALVAGGVLAGAAKLGLLKGLWVAILALKKFIVIAVIAVVAAVKKLFKRGDSAS
jgi:uncharacterized membrane-anchored protein